MFGVSNLKNYWYMQPQWPEYVKLSISGMKILKPKDSTYPEIWLEYDFLKTNIIYFI